jgi:hypothetical protein
MAFSNFAANIENMTILYNTLLGEVVAEKAAHHIKDEQQLVFINNVLSHCKEIFSKADEFPGIGIS